MKEGGGGGEKGRREGNLNSLVGHGRHPDHPHLVLLFDVVRGKKRGGKKKKKREKSSPPRGESR